MKYIKVCPECGKKIRFPLDRGRIRVYCQCGYNIIIDPDDTSLYENGEFDLKPGTNPSGLYEKMNDYLSNLLKKFSWSGIINGLLDIKYRIQNIRFLPDRERNRLLAYIIIIILLIVSALYFF